MIKKAERKVQAQYEALPYPTRAPKDEARRLITGSPSHLLEIDHYVFGGRRPDRSLRLLIAGGGTGDALVMLAEQLRQAGRAAEIVYLDQSTAARSIAEARIAARSLSGINFVTGSLLDLDRLNLGRFDYIDCCGVLHHLEDPGAGLAALASTLVEHGGIGVMVYGGIGRTGVYEIQQALRSLAPDDLPHAERLAAAKKLLAGLPATNWLRRNGFVQDHVTGGDAGLFDLLLHSQDRPFSAEEIFDLADASGLRVQAMIETLRYDPAFYLTDPALRRRAADLSPRDAAGLAERLCGNMIKHIAYLTPSSNPQRLPIPDDLDWVPVLREVDGAALARAIGPAQSLEGEMTGLAFRLALPRSSAAILSRIDGIKTLGEIAQEVVSGPLPKLSGEAFLTDFAELFRILNGLNHLLLWRR